MIHRLPDNSRLSYNYIIASFCRIFQRNLKKAKSRGTVESLYPTYAPLCQRITGIEIVQGFDVHNQANHLPGTRGDGTEPDIIGTVPS